MDRKMTWYDASVEMMETLPRHENLIGLHDHIGDLVAVFTSNHEVHVGRVKMVPAATRGNRTLAITNGRRIHRNGYRRRFSRLPIWWLRDSTRVRGYSILETCG